jgi:ADP-glucose pyrophosphorylase
VLRRRLDEDARDAASARDFGNSIIANLLRHDTVVAVPFAGY